MKITLAVEIGGRTLSWDLPAKLVCKKAGSLPPVCVGHSITALSYFGGQLVVGLGSPEAQPYVGGGHWVKLTDADELEIQIEDLRLPFPAPVRSLEAEADLGRWHNPDQEDGAG